MTHRALIIGAGIGGLTTAIGLKRIGYEPVVFERAPQVTSNGTTLVLWPNALRVLDELGLAAEIMDLGVRNHKTSVFTAKGKLMYELHLDVEAVYGYPVLTVLRADLQRVLLERLGDGVVEWGKEFSASEQDERQVTARFAGGQLEQGCLLVGADGIHSNVRSSLLGDGYLRFCGFTAYRGMVDNSSLMLPQLTGMEVWGEGRRFGLFHTGRQGVYWFATVNGAADRYDSQPGIKQQLLEGFADSHPFVGQVIAQTEEAKILRHLIYDIPSLPYWSKGRITLLGDAAHAMTPNLGQGACQAIEDSGVLCESVRSEKNLISALQRYEAVRVPRVRKVVGLSHRMGRVTQWSHPLLCGIRNTAFSLVPGFMKLKQLEWIIKS